MAECSKVVGARWDVLIVSQIADLLRFPCKIYLSENELKKVTIASVVKWGVRVTDVPQFTQRMLKKNYIGLFGEMSIFVSLDVLHNIQK